MSRKISRRTVLRGTLAGAVVVAGFDMPMTRHDWQKHYQPLRGAFVNAKRHFDPDRILTPGQQIF